jgi:23S rRNA (cytosine1962-C5)-methyltransferase
MYRDSVPASTDTNAYRLIHRGAAGFPDLTVDRYADVLVANVYAAGPKRTPLLAMLRPLATAIPARAVYIKYRPAEASKLTAAEREQLAPDRPILGEPVEQVLVRENGITFIIRPAAGLSTGLFLDMRGIRRWVRNTSKDKSVLNCFAYTCGFGVAALLGGATRAVNIDISRKYLDWGKENTALNSGPPDPKDYISGDVFDWLKRFGKRGQTFDRVILDPPPYSTTKESRFSIQHDYAGLISLAAPVVAPDGYLVVCANAAELSETQFANQIKKGLAPSAKTIRFEPVTGLDFLTEGEKYLKVLVFRRSHA